MHPGYTVLLLDCKECVGNAELVMFAKLEEEPQRAMIQTHNTSIPVMVKRN